MELFSLIFLWTLLLLGAMYVSIYEEAPLWERVNIFMVGFGMYVAIIYIASSIA